MDTEMPKQEISFIWPPKMATKSSKTFFVAQMSLRMVVVAFTLAGAITMVTSEQSVTIFGIVMQARYTYSSAFRFKVIADSVVCAISLLSVLLVYSFSHRKSNTNNYFFLLCHDMVNMIVLISGCAASTAIGSVGKYGQSQTGWIKICDRVDKFCDRILVSIALSYLASISLFVLTIMGAYKLKSLAVE
ncbi:CASP-like protein 1F2 [Olea europaea var. sylvestris]|uniref:CASP-like protein n=1 Tax=Olea europaea subsp. europaea TaxID=158383 RepID=A0A8S0SNX5_OLEEU|nr:CASP-like protein 1F2 [Olea europaea var. sylvestris]CAA2994684.1 CASP 1F2 [Olea europaea subsp. europaea]